MQSTNSNPQDKEPSRSSQQQVQHIVQKEQNQQTYQENFINQNITKNINIKDNNLYNTDNNLLYDDKESTKEQRSSTYIPNKSDTNISESGINLDITKETIINTSLLPTKFSFITVCSNTHIGRRKNQEDRIVIAPSLMNGELAFFGIFDGTVREHASEWIHKNILRIFYETKYFRKFSNLSQQERCKRINRTIFIQAIYECFIEADRQLLEYCALNDYPYSASTAITVFLHIPSQTLYVAHLADSHVAIGMPINKFYSITNDPSVNIIEQNINNTNSINTNNNELNTINYIVGIPKDIDKQNTHVTNDMTEAITNTVRNMRISAGLTLLSNNEYTKYPLIGQFLTFPHRPDDPNELTRIREKGGEQVYLHGRKPFIRGGDFNKRKMAMQLNYSRAFGGKDLKMYGQSCIPDIRVIDIPIPNINNTNLKSINNSSNDDDTNMIILGSDGLWDVLTPTNAVNASSILLHTYNDILKVFNSHTNGDNNDNKIDIDKSLNNNTSRLSSSHLSLPQSPSEFLVQVALRNHDIKGSNDNVTCIVVYF